MIPNLTIAKALIAAGRPFRASGTCMWPHLRPGDLLHVEPRTADNIALGDVVLFIRAGRLTAAHRTIEKHVVGGRTYVLTRADRASAGNDGPLFDNDILGVVTWIERKGRRLEVCRDPGARRKSSLADRCLLEWSDGRLRQWAYRAAARVQGVGTYRLAARGWLARNEHELRWAIHAPLHPGQPCGLQRKLSLNEFAGLPLLPEAGGVDRWTLLTWLGKGQRPAAYAKLVACLQPIEARGWRVIELEYRHRFCGTQLDQLVEAKVTELLASRNLSIVESVSV
jgi:hypothetical protein